MTGARGAGGVAAGRDVVLLLRANYAARRMWWMVEIYDVWLRRI